MGNKIENGMELEYMNLLAENPNLKPSLLPIEGMSQIEIESLRNEYNNGNEFPKSFEEFLEIGGKRSHTNIVNEDWEDNHYELKDCLDYTKIKLERPVFVFDQLDSQLTIFFLDKADDDPKTYILDPMGKFENLQPLFRPTGYTFSELVNESIRRIKNNIPM